MEFTFNDGTYSLPDTLQEMTLAQYTGYMTEYGQSVRQRVLELDVLPAGPERDLEYSLLYMQRYTEVFSYYSGIPLDDVQNLININQVLSYVGATEISMAVEQKQLVLLPEYDVAGNAYVLQPPASADLDNYHAFKAMQDLARKMLQLSTGDFSVLPDLAAAYLRLPGEDFNPDNYLPGTERNTIMQGMNMFVALSLLQYLASTLELFVASMESYIPPPDVEGGGGGLEI